MKNNGFEMRFIQIVETAEAIAPLSSEVKERAIARMVNAVRIKEQKPRVKRLAFALTFIIVIGLLTGGFIIFPEKSNTTNLLIEAAYAVSVADSLHVRGERIVVDSNAPRGSQPGRYEFWLSPDGFRQDWYDTSGQLVRSFGGNVATGKVWQYSLHPSGKSMLVLYETGSEPLVSFVATTREQFRKSQLRLEHIIQHGHMWRVSSGARKNKRVAIAEEQLDDPAIGEQHGTMEYYLDPESSDLVGMTEYGPKTEGKPLISSVYPIEYNIDVPLDTFEYTAPPGTTIIRRKQAGIRPGSDMPFSPKNADRTPRSEMDE